MNCCKDNQPKILFVVNDPAFFLSHRLNIARAARSAGFEVRIAAPNLRGAEQIVEQGFEFQEFFLNRWSHNPVSAILSIISLVRLYRRLKPLLVHHVTIKPVLYGTVAARLAGVPAIVNAISGRGYVFLKRGLSAAFRRWLIRLLYRIVLRGGRQRVIFQNRDDQEYFISRRLVGAEAAVLIRGSGVDLERFCPGLEPDAVPLVMFPARLLWEKGIGEFIEAARIVRQSGINARFVAAGKSIPGNPGSVPCSQVEKWRNEGLVEFWGECKEMEHILPQAHMICLPSYGEGLPKVLLEAAACARPIIATDVPGCREVVRSGQTGCLVPACDSRALAEAIKLLCADKELRVRLGKNGRQYVVESGFGEDKVAEQTLHVYKNLLKQTLTPERDRNE